MSYENKIKFKGKFQEAGKVNKNGNYYWMPIRPKEETSDPNDGSKPIGTKNNVWATKADEKKDNVAERWKPPTSDEDYWIPSGYHLFNSKAGLNLVHTGSGCRPPRFQDDLGFIDLSTVEEEAANMKEQRMQRLNELKMEIKAKNPQIMGVPMPEWLKMEQEDAKPQITFDQVTPEGFATTASVEWSTPNFDFTSPLHSGSTTCGLLYTTSGTIEPIQKTEEKFSETKAFVDAREEFRQQALEKVKALSLESEMWSTDEVVDSFLDTFSECLLAVQVKMKNMYNECAGPHWDREAGKIEVETGPCPLVNLADPNLKIWGNK